MTWISSVFSRYRRNLNLASAALLSLILIFDLGGLNQYVSQGSLAVFYSVFTKARSSVEELTSVSAENRRLRLLLVETSERLMRLEEMKRENSRLRSVLGFEPPAGFKLLPAAVIAVYGEPIPYSVTINRGSGDTVVVNEALINQDGLIGRIVDVSNDYAAVQLLTNPSNRVAARVDGSREMGIIKYIPGRGLVLDNFPIQGNIKEGDLILSSGLGGIYPAGLVIGIVESVVRPAENAFCDVLVQPAANFMSLEELFILRQDEP